MALTSYSDNAALVNYARLGWFIGLGRMRLVLLVQVVMNSLNIILDLRICDRAKHDRRWQLRLATAISEVVNMLLSLVLALGVVRDVGGHWDLPRIRAFAPLRRLVAINGNL